MPPFLISQLKMDKPVSLRFLRSMINSFLMNTVSMLGSVVLWTPQAYSSFFGHPGKKPPLRGKVSNMLWMKSRLVDSCDLSSMESLFKGRVSLVQKFLFLCFVSSTSGMYVGGMNLDCRGVLLFQDGCFGGFGRGCWLYVSDTRGEGWQCCGTLNSE